MQLQGMLKADTGECNATKWFCEGKTRTRQGFSEAANVGIPKAQSLGQL